MKPVGDAFMRLIKMVIVPLVFASLLVGVASLGDIRKLGRMGVRTLLPLHGHHRRGREHRAWPSPTSSIQGQLHR